MKAGVTIVAAAVVSLMASRTDAGRTADAASVVLITTPRDTAVLEAPKEVRVVLGHAVSEVPVGDGEPWQLVDAWGRVHARGTGPSWRIERSGRRLRGATADGRSVTAWSEEPFAMTPSDGATLVRWGGKRFRGELRYVATDTAIVVANVLPIEEYLRGVVPLEIGPRSAGERSAVEAQAIAARSYTVVRAMEGVTREWDLTARATDQVYGGVDAETAAVDAAIRATHRQVITFADRVVRAPYHSTCGGSTAQPSEVFRGNGEAYLRAVSDRVPGTDRFWCDISPRFNWERSFDQAALVAAVGRQTVGRGTRVIRATRVSGVTTSGRVQGLAFDTDRGEVVLSGNDLRFALVTPGGEILPSTYFSAQSNIGADRAVASLTLRGRGNGHGVGMCQWGAIGRARAGMDAATILLSYFPGTSIAQVQ